MTIDKCIEALQNIKNRHPGRNEVVVGVRSCEGGKIESLSLQAKSRDGENEIVFEEKFEDSRPAEVQEALSLPDEAWNISCALSSSAGIPASGTRAPSWSANETSGSAGWCRRSCSACRTGK